MDQCRTWDCSRDHALLVQRATCPRPRPLLGQLGTWFRTSLELALSRSDLGGVELDLLGVCPSPLLVEVLRAARVGWALDAHNVAGPMVTHPVQLLAYHLATRPGCDKRLLRGEGGILAAFGASHINDLHKNLKPKERAKRYSVFW